MFRTACSPRPGEHVSGGSETGYFLPSGTHCSVPTPHTAPAWFLHLVLGWRLVGISREDGCGVSPFPTSSLLAPHGKEILLAAFGSPWVCSLHTEVDGVTLGKGRQPLGTPGQQLLQMQDHRPLSQHGGGREALPEGPLMDCLISCPNKI